MGLKVEDKGFFVTINFFKKKENWQEILRDAALEVSVDMIMEAEDIAYTNFRRVTGGLGDSIDADVYIEGDKVNIDLMSDHVAANIMEYGGYIQTPARSDRLKQYANAYGMQAQQLVNTLEKTQPFLEPHPFIRPALVNNRDNMHKEIGRQFRLKQEELVG
tara:strand:+ start:106 stop:588 length:483 start_codon:yes stop_codon:yes gene_type:complete